MQGSELTSAADGPNRLARDLTLYTIARLGLVALVAAVLVVVNVPVLVALLVALAVGLPLSFVLLRGLRQRVAVGLAHSGQRRRAERDKLRAQLRGEDADPS